MGPDPDGEVDAPGRASRGPDLDGAHTEVAGRGGGRQAHREGDAAGGGRADDGHAVRGAEYADARGRVQREPERVSRLGGHLGDDRDDRPGSHLVRPLGAEGRRDQQEGEDGSPERHGRPQIRVAENRIPTE